MELCQHVRLVLLLLGITLGSIKQIVASGQQVSCNKTQYKSDNLCCSRCPPGHYRKEVCTATTETVCLPCESGTFASKWNSAPTCRTCYPCSKHLVEKTPCNATQAAFCVCPDGYSCTQYDALNVCQICTPDPVSTPTETYPTESPPDVSTLWIWIILGVILFSLTAIVIILCIKPSPLKTFGRLIKNKTCSDSIAQAGTTVVIGVVVEDEMIKTPLQENVHNLSYPIQESSTTEIGESTLIPKRLNI